MKKQKKIEWPTWPFTRLTPKEMATLLRKLDQQKREKAEPAPF